MSADLLDLATSVDVVTEADREVERFIRGRIARERRAPLAQE